MIRASLIAVPLAVVGCSAPSPVPQSSPTAVASTPAPAPSPTPFAPPTTTLPRPLLGSWTADKTGTCTPGTELRIVVEPTQIRFYESVARIVSATQVDPHSWGIDADVTAEGQTERRSFDLNLNEDERGTMTRVEAPYPDVTYIRCRDSK